MLIGGHLDSWDLGTGAIDDGAGVGITMAAGQLIGDAATAHRRARIRVVAFANEEQGLHGGKAYAADARRRPHAATSIGAESDFGAGRIYAFATSAPEYARAADAQIAAALAPLGIEHTPGKGGPGPDIGPVRRNAAWPGRGWHRTAPTTSTCTTRRTTPSTRSTRRRSRRTWRPMPCSRTWRRRREGGFGSAPRPAAE